jgi:hypothetical protein
MARNNLISLAALLVAAPAALAQMMPAEGPVLPRDGSPVSTQGTVRGFEDVRYRIDLEAGETLRVEFEPVGDKDCRFSILSEGSTTPLYLSHRSGNRYAASPGGPGTYVIRVYQRPNPARRGKNCDYRISFAAVGG